MGRANANNEFVINFKNRLPKVWAKLPMDKHSIFQCVPSKIVKNFAHDHGQDFGHELGLNLSHSKILYTRLVQSIAFIKRERFAVYSSEATKNCPAQKTNLNLPKLMDF